MSRFLFFLIFFFSIRASAQEPQLSKLKVNGKFKIQVYARANNARSLALGPHGFVFVGTRSDGRVYALAPDKNKDGLSDKVYTLASGLNMPNGVAFNNGDLYVAEVNRIRVFRNIMSALDNPGAGELWGPEFPSEKHHGWKFIAFGPDGWLYVPVGAPCNVCLEQPDKYAAIHRVSPDGKTLERVARGVRNSVGFDWHPSTKQLWFSDNGRDNLGDEVPPCEFNQVTKMDSHFGFPFCHGGTILDPEFGKGHSCSEFIPPSFSFPAHSAPLGLRFIKNTPDLKGSVLVAEHGSWNRSTPIGYQIRRIELSEKGKVLSAEPFITGFLQGAKAWGRPVDLLELPDQSILISDDESGTIYRLTHL